MSDYVFKKPIGHKHNQCFICCITERVESVKWRDVVWRKARASVIESLLHNPHDAYSPNVTRECCVRGRRMTLGLSPETELRLCLLRPWKATNPLVAPRAGQHHTGNVVSLLCPCERRSNRFFSALSRPLRRLREPSCVTPSKLPVRISIVSVQQCSSAGWTSSSFLEGTKHQSGEF